MKIRDFTFLLIGAVLGVLAFTQIQPLVSPAREDLSALKGEAPRERVVDSATNTDRQGMRLLESASEQGGLAQWEGQLEAELRTHTSEPQLMDGGMPVIRQAVGSLRTSLGKRSVEELSMMVNSLSDPARQSVQRGVMLAAVLAEVAARNPEEAVRLMRDKVSAYWRELTDPFVFPEIARKNPGFLSVWLSRAGTNWQKPTSELLEGIKALASVSADSAFSLIASSSGTADRAALYSAVFRQLGESDPLNASRKLESIDPKYRAKAVGEIALGMSVASPHAAIEWLKQNKDTPVPRFYLSSIVYEWLAKDKGEAFASLRLLPESLLLHVLGSNTTADRLQRKDPGATLELLSRLTPTRSNKDVFLRNLIPMLDRAPEQVIGWLDGQTADDLNSPLRSRVYSMWAQRDPEAAYSSLKARPDLLNNESIVAGLAQGMAAGSLADITNWSANLPAEQRDRFQQEAIGFAAERQPRAVMNYLAAQPLRATPDILQKLGGSLAELDINEAKSWCLRQTGPQGEAAVAGVITGWAKSDAERASIWLAELPPGKNRNAGIKVLVAEVAESDPAAAAE